MKTVTINLYSFDELPANAKERALIDHANFLISVPDINELDEQEYRDEYDREEVEESIRINEYLFFWDGELASITHYTGKHQKSGITEFHFHGTTQAI